MSGESERTIHAEVVAARIAFSAAGIESSDVDAVELAAFVLGCDAAEVRRRMVLRDKADEAFVDRYAGLVAERSSRVPLQHITGRACFRRLTLAVGPGVFVPRPETEVLVEHALMVVQDVVSSGESPVVVDLCTGSGAVALAIADEAPACLVHAAEVDPLAHGWAVANRDRLGLDVELRLGDARTAYEDLEGRVDVVTCNPPYIPDGLVPVDPEVRVHDPATALYGGSADGLRLPLEMARRAAVLLRPGGVLLMEHADVQGRAVVAALADQGSWEAVVDHADLTGRDRVVRAVRAATS